MFDKDQYFKGVWRIYVLDLTELSEQDRYKDPSKTSPPILKSKAVQHIPSTYQLKRNIPLGYEFLWHDFNRSNGHAFVGVIRS